MKYLNEFGSWLGVPHCDKCSTLLADVQVKETKEYLCSDCAIEDKHLTQPAPGWIW